MNWKSHPAFGFILEDEGEEVAATSNIERDGRRGWFWHSFINASEGFCDTLEQAQAAAEVAKTPQRLQ